MAGRSMNDPLPEHLLVLRDVQIHELIYDERRLPYFEVVWDEETLKVRVHHSSEWVQWIENHLDLSLDVTIFPYQWEACGRSGVVNYFREAKILE